MKIDLKPSSPFIRSLKNHPFLYWIGFSVLAFAVFKDVGGVLSFITFFLAIALYSQKKKEDKEIRKILLIHEAEKYIDGIKEAKAVPVINSSGSIFLDKGENLFLKEDVQLQETRSVRTSSGAYGGVRIMKGVTIGQYRGRSSSSLEWATLDRGSLFLTDKKLVFMGSKENRTIPLKKIVAVETFLNAIEITVDGRSKAIQFPVKNPYIWSTVVSIAKSAPDPLKLGDLQLNIQFQ